MTFNIVFKAIEWEREGVGRGQGSVALRYQAIHQGGWSEDEVKGWSSDSLSTCWRLARVLITATPKWLLLYSRIIVETLRRISSLPASSLPLSSFLFYSSSTLSSSSCRCPCLLLLLPVEPCSMAGDNCDVYHATYHGRSLGRPVLTTLTDV